MLQKNTFGQNFFRISCTGSKVPFWQFFNPIQEVCVIINLLTRSDTQSWIYEPCFSKKFDVCFHLSKINFCKNNSGFVVSGMGVWSDEQVK